jgi:hypothetical protein
MKLKNIYADVCVIRNTTTAISWLTTPEHTWFGKHGLRQIKNLMADLGHPHIFHTDSYIRRSI